jgi:dipeptide/tripeptide permease
MKTKHAIIILAIGILLYLGSLFLEYKQLPFETFTFVSALFIAGVGLLLLLYVILTRPKSEQQERNPKQKTDNKEYKKSLEDEIDWKIIDQLHTATLNFSTKSLELKKLLFTLVGIAVPTLIKLTHDKLDTSLFITIYLLVVIFWLLDSFTYYYQEKLRERMDTHFNLIKARNTLVEKVSDNYTLENNRTSPNRWIRSLLNHSMMLYILILLLNIFTHLLYIKGVIG